MKIKLHKLLSLPLAALLLSTAFAAEPEWKEVTDAGLLFGLGEYAADWDAQTQTLRLYTDERGTLKEFRTIEHVLEQPQPTLLERDAYFLLPRDGKYAIFSRDGEQLTAYRYNGVEFYGDVAVGTFSPDDMTLWDADLIDLKTKKVIASSGAGEPIGVSSDERSFTVGDTVYDADGNILFQTEVGNIVSPEVRETAQGVLWIGSRDGKNALYYDNTCVSGQYDDIQPYDIGDTQLFTASSDGTEVLIDTDGREITKTAGDIMLLASGLAAVTDGNTVTYWNQGGQAASFEQYAEVQCFVGERTDAFDRVLVQTGAGKWGVVRRDGVVLLAPEFDSVTNVVGSNSLCVLQNGNTRQLWNLDSGTALNIPAEGEIYTGEAFDVGTADEIACVVTLPNGVCTASLYDMNGTLLRENIRAAFRQNGQTLYAQVTEPAADGYTEVLTDGEGAVLFAAPSGQMVTYISSAVICTAKAGIETFAADRSFLRVDFTSAAPVSREDPFEKREIGGILLAAAGLLCAGYAVYRRRRLE